MWAEGRVQGAGTGGGVGVVVVGGGRCTHLASAQIAHGELEKKGS